MKTKFHKEQTTLESMAQKVQKQQTSAVCVRERER